MLRELDDQISMMVSGGEGANSTMPDYCSGYNGIALGGLVFGAIAFAGIVFGGCCASLCCYRGLRSTSAVQKMVDSGGCCSGWAGRLFLNHASGNSCWIVGTLFVAMYTLGIGTLGMFLTSSNEGIWNCGGRVI